MEKKEVIITCEEKDFIISLSENFKEFNLFSTKFNNMMTSIADKFIEATTYAEDEIILIGKEV